jgi:hypothetical protein
MGLRYYDGIADVSFQQRFFAKVKIMPSGCHEWTGAHDRKRGYGFVWIPKERRNGRAPRVAYAIAFGLVPSCEMDVCHHCDNPSCVNPQHLFLGTRSDNMKDCSRKCRLGGVFSNGMGMKLSAPDVLRIRALVASGVSRPTVAEQYHVGKYTIRDIMQRRTWKHI